MALIPLHGGARPKSLGCKGCVPSGNVVAYAIVDDEFADAVRQYNWHCDAYGYPVRNSSKAEKRSGVRSIVKLHQFVWALSGRDPEKEIDHKCGDKLDARIESLRSASRSLNSANRPKQANNRSAWKGVTQHRTRTGWMWKATIGKGGKVVLKKYFSRGLVGWIQAAQCVNAGYAEHFPDCIIPNPEVGMPEVDAVQLAEAFADRYPAFACEM